MEENSIKPLFKRAGLTKKQFAELVGLSHQTVNNWGSSKNIPHWVDSWLRLYIKAKALEELREAVHKSGICDEGGEGKSPTLGT